MLVSARGRRGAVEGSPADRFALLDLVHNSPVATCRANGPRSDRSIPTREMIVAGVPCREYLPGADPTRAVGAGQLGSGAEASESCADNRGVEDGLLLIHRDSFGRVRRDGGA